MIETTGITAAPMIAWPAPSPSSPEPHSGAPRGAGLDGSARPSTVAGRAVNASSVDVPKRKSTFTEISYTNVLTLPSEDPWGGGLLHLQGGARSSAHPTQCGISEFTTRCAKGRHKPNISRCMPGAGLSRSCVGRCCPTCQPSSRIGENPPCGMIGRVEETSASFEARSAPRLYPTERLGVQFPGPTRPTRRRDVRDHGEYWRVSGPSSDVGSQETPILHRTEEGEVLMLRRAFARDRAARQ